MALVGKLIKGGLAVKAIQVAQRELKKPENQKRINDAVVKLKEPPRPRPPLDAEQPAPYRSCVSSVTQTSALVRTLIGYRAPRREMQ